ncbi:TetR/AcrR family transcriptional regulator [Sodalis ligni]|jgi:TetR/AcrR family transcriptional repressor of lmrAB and yxaGH operons|uniref:TetR family transcriptional regulator n=1 Tax=Sodalis ligni TaxID=2697027 RepID=A0A4R1NRS8_9GAMM|nr:TetR/AcrR family transcriptional regulator [Sodalis ligni]TCL07496.1 TetR family transcriptional regulator [Sodalis ligni]
MAKLRKVEDDVLIERLSKKFKDVGFEGASMSMLSSAAGLTKSSLYHRFPNGKEQIAEEVLKHTRHFLDDEVFPILNGSLPPAEKMDLFASSMSKIYLNGAESCLLNMLSPPRNETNSCGNAIAETFRQLLEGLANVAKESGATADSAQIRAEQVLVELQGALVVARGISDLAIFKRMLHRLPNIILQDPKSE